MSSAVQAVDQILGGSYTSSSGLSFQSFNAWITQQQSSMAGANFNEILATAQTSVASSQTEEQTGTPTQQVFQNDLQSWLNSGFTGQRNMPSDNDAAEQPAAKTADRSITNQKAALVHGDTYVSRDDSQRSGKTQRPEAAGEVSKTAAKPTKHRRENLQGKNNATGDEAVSEQSSGTDQNDAFRGALTSEQSKSNPETGKPQASQAKSDAADSSDSSKPGKASDLAFAVKISGASTPSQPTLTTQSQQSGTQSSGCMPPEIGGEFLQQMKASGEPPPEAGETAPTQNSVGQNSVGGIGQAIVFGSQAQPVTSADNSSTEETVEGTVKTEQVLEAEKTPQQSVKSVQVQISGDGDQKVDVRLMERGGSLTVGVRSSDETLARNLQQNLGDLASGLKSLHMRAEWWQPKADSAASADRVTQSSSNQSPGEERNGSGSQQQDGRKGRDLDWQEELAELQNSSKNGALYTWHL